jgi:DNA-directed RNA polymerase subunit H (RpoH/RPB5)
MEDRALEILRTMLSRRKLDTKTERIITDDLDRVNLYTIGDILVVFSQKDKGLLDRDISNFLKFADTNGYKNGIIIVALSPPSENVERVVKTYTKNRVQFFHIRQLQFDITTHRMVMPHRILNDEEKTAVFEEFKIVKPEEQLPWIDSQDAMVKWIGAIPGDVIEVTRHSDVAGTSRYYRYCVEDVNIA